MIWLALLVVFLLFLSGGAMAHREIERGMARFHERLSRLESSLSSGPAAMTCDHAAGFESRLSALESDPCRGVKALDVTTLRADLDELRNEVRTIGATDATANELAEVKAQLETLAGSVALLMDVRDAVMRAMDGTAVPENDPE